ncbi:translocation/assembly module TamB domain-containing protein [Aureibacter tunicatorum]|uniref:Translocation and assembly module TamB C-terminal domain-containing protein n=1 Tax=Aureibacter tunicatorum TaxID=866807 RepID=A0AAE3XLY1_9BACT|nr:translocation/assembly module TamB domain-containing protein [Aureibacter tunicatorum]MDR6240351.1 hypothetical protein [Aureibacter tunicatorum]
MRTSIALLLLAGILFVLMHLPPVQLWLVNKVTTFLEDRTGYKTNIDKVYFNWFDELTVEGLDVLDLNDSSFIKAEKVSVDFDFPALLDPNKIMLNEAYIHGARVELLKRDTSDLYTVVDWSKKLVGAFKDSVASDTLVIRDKKLAKPFIVNKIYLSGSDFLFTNHYKAPIEHGFDYFNFKFSDLTGEFSNMYIRGDTFKVQLNQLTGIDSISEIEVGGMSGNYLTSNNAMHFDDLKLLMNETEINGQMRWRYDSYASFSHFIDSVHMKINLDESKIYSSDVGYFNKFIDDQVPAHYWVQGDFEGVVSNFKVSDAKVSYGKSSKLSGDCKIIGAPDLKKTFIIADVKKASSNADDLSYYLTERVEPLDNLGSFHWNGSFSGFIDDFDLNVDLHGKNAGSNQLKVSIKKDPLDSTRYIYNGDFEMLELPLGHLITGNTDLVDDLNGKVKFALNGFDPLNDKMDIDLSMDSLKIQGKNVKNVAFRYKSAAQLGLGSFEVRDKNADLAVYATVNTQNSVENVQFNGEINTLNFMKLGLSNMDLIMGMEFFGEIHDFDLDRVNGLMSFSNIKLDKGGKQKFHSKRVNVQIHKQNKDNFINIKSERINAQIVGDFRVTRLVRDLANVAQRYALQFLNDSKAQWIKINPAKRPYEADYDFTFKRMTDLASVFSEDLVLPDEFNLQGKIKKDSIYSFSANTFVDNFEYGAHSAFNTSLDMKLKLGLKNAYNYFNLSVLSEEQVLGSVLTENMLGEVVWINDKMDFLGSIKATELKSDVNLSGRVNYYKDSSDISLSSSQLRLLDHVWTINPSNKVSISKNRFAFYDWSFTHDDQLIGFDGTIGSSLDDQFNFYSENFDMQPLSDLLGKKLEGMMDAKVNASGIAGKSPIVISDILISECKVEDIPIGTISLDTEWDTKSKQVKVKSKVFDEFNEFIQLSGFYSPYKLKDQLNLTCRLNYIPLSYAGPFLNDFSHFNGFANGTVLVSGSLTNPLLDGIVSIGSGSATYNFTKVNYSMYGDILLKNRKVIFDDLKIFDNELNEGIIFGSIDHGNPSKIMFDIGGEFENILALNTELGDNSKFYGKAYGTGSIALTGDMSNIKFSADATTGKNTKIKIPLTEDFTAVEEESFIRFKKKESGEKVHKGKKEKTKPKVSNYEIDMNLDITPEAVFEVIFDPLTGDIIRGQGNGDLNIQYNKSGDFNMFGDFVFQKGGYNFTFYNLISKEFNIKPQSKITWSGDPYQAKVDLMAEYTQLTSVASLFSPEMAKAPDIRRKYPVTVSLGIKGDLLQPDLDFDINVFDYPENIIYDGNSVPMGVRIESFENTLRTNEQEMNKQVFSLIILKKLAAEDSGLDAGNSVGNSMSEFFSNQLSYWINQAVDENLEVDIDLGSFNEAQLETFQLRLSYAFLDGRIRVTRDGGFTDAESKASVSSVLGDWTVEAILTKDGKWKLKMYNRNNFNSSSSNLQRATTTTIGFSVQHTRNFNTLRELLGIKPRNNNQLPPVYIDDSSPLPIEDNFIFMKDSIQ